MIWLQSDYTRKNMTFIEFKKRLLDAEITLPKFSKLIKVSEKNIQSYKKKVKYQTLSLSLSPLLLGCTKWEWIIALSSNP